MPDYKVDTPHTSIVLHRTMVAVEARGGISWARNFLSHITPQGPAPSEGQLLPRLTGTRAG